LKRFGETSEYDRAYFISQQSLLKKVELELGGGPGFFSKGFRIWGCLTSSLFPVPAVLI
jgi:hypothetical protein